MKLEWEAFSDVFSLANYVNENNVRRENIQEIIEIKSGFILLYWINK